jgi:drug/metabolite transporter (DMT)-like permease
MTWAPLLALTAALGFGVSTVLLRRGLLHATPLAAATVSVAFTASAVWGMAVVTAAPFGQLLSPSILPFLAAGLAAPGLARIALFLGVHRVGVARAGALAGTTPLFSVVLAVLVLGERPSPLLLIGAVAIVIGGALLAARGNRVLAWRRRDLLFPVVAALGFALRDVVSRYGFREPTHPLIAAAAATVTSLVVVAGFAILQSRRVELRREALGLLALSGCAEAVAYLTMWRALAIADVALVSPLVNAHSMFTLGLTALFLRDLERVTWRIVAATALIVAGVAIVVRFGVT